MYSFVLLILSINTNLNSIYVENWYISYSLPKDLFFKIRPLSTQKVCGTLHSRKIVVKTLVIDIPILFIKVKAQSYLVNKRTAVNINIKFFCIF